MIRLLVVDDSPLMRKLVGQVFAAEPDFVLAFARDGVEALAALTEFEPDVITLDVQMPRMGGLQCLDRIMVESPRPVVMVSSLTTEGAAETLEALQLGAVDFIAKPEGAISLEMEAFAPRLVQTVRAAASAKPRRARRLAERIRRQLDEQLPPRPPIHARRAGTPAVTAEATGDLEGLVLIGCSTGGPPALETVLSSLPGELGWAVLVAQHMPATFTASLARRLDGVCAVSVSEVSALVGLERGRVYIAQGDADLLVARRLGRLVALPAPPVPEHRWRPSVDRMVESALTLVPPRRLIGVLMTGMGSDGAAAMTRLHAAGGRTVAEAEETAVVWGMPGELVKAGGADVVAPVDAIGRQVLAWTEAS